MNHESLEPEIQKAAESYHRPPVTVPREEMWARIRAARTPGRKPEPSPVRDLRRYRRATIWAAGIAAVLVLGIRIGMGLRPSPAGPGVEPAALAPEGVALTLAATQHLSRSEAFLTGFRSDLKTGNRDENFTAAARGLLSTTRLLLDSPELKDARTRALLEDLELVLAQIAQLKAEHGSDEVDLITEGLNQRGLMPRLRSAIPAGPAAPRARGEL